MKPYSKKYLTLALAGVLAASIPVSAFANNDEPNKQGQTNPPAITDPQKPGANEGDGNTGTGEAGKTETEAEKKAREEKEKAIKDAEKAREEAQKAKEEADRLKKEKEEREKREREEAERKRRYETLSLSSVKYDGTYLTGYTSAKADIYIKRVSSRYGYGYSYDRGYERIGYADNRGDFKIKVDLKEGETYSVVARDGLNESREVEFKNDNYTNISGTKVSATDLRLMGRTLTGYIKNHPFEFARVYKDGKLLGSFRTDKNSYFSVELSESLYNNEVNNLRFYLDSKTVENKKFKITEALDGQKLVKGTANAKDEITVYDASNRKLGSITVNNSGVFTVFLDRALIYGETIKIEAKDEKGAISKLEYKVTKNAVETVKAISYIKGYPDGTFKPQANVTRAEAAQMFATLLNGGANFGTSSATRFSDASDNWFSKAVNYVVAKGLISGYPDGTFKPNESITRAEFAQMISGYVKNEKKSTTDFQDVKDHWAKDAIDKLYGNKNVSGYPDGSFKPNAKITRAEAVTILNSVFDRNTTALSLNNVNKSALNKFSDVSEGFWAYYNIIDAANSHDRERLNSSSDVDIWK
ncbi:S-layer homology domain-containing protein [Peptoniphilus hominis (ex Hitch et al. 2025)]|uniref:S-layer homology domain-containing protein n=1 Tax=Peptoniphilus hominis (ex Hitch et al. 2025) TaxID=3133174 RepID=A0ABV1CFU9_9FIRM